MSLLCHLVMAFPEHKLYHNLIKIDEKQVWIKKIKSIPDIK
jgi:hypothetical protein